MTFQSILVPVDESTASAERVRIAANTASRFGADLVGLCFAPALSGVDPRELPPAEFSKCLSERELLDRVERTFASGAAKPGVRSVESRVVEGRPIDEAIAEMRCVDLSVLAQGNVETDAGRFERALAEQALLAVGGPILFVPYAPATDVLADHVAVAWDGGREAARAVRDALPLLERAKRVTVLSFGARMRLDQNTARAQARLAAYLAAHGVESKSRPMACTPDEAGELLLSQLADLSADLLVMGAYGHARVREVLLGGVTRTLLDSMTVPVLMSH
jgi:nucleotide-binding universal stress UspA family protein